MHATAWSHHVASVRCSLKPGHDVKRAAHVRKVPIPDSCIAAKAVLFDHLVGTREQRGWYGEVERFGRLEIDDYSDRINPGKG